MGAGPWPVSERIDRSSSLKYLIDSVDPERNTAANPGPLTGNPPP
jgi:hypothetical protein